MNYLEDYFTEEFCKDLRKVRFEDQFKKILYCLDNYNIIGDYERVFELAKNKIVGSINQDFDFNNPEITINKIDDLSPTDILIFIDTHMDYTDNIEEFVLKKLIEATNEHVKVAVGVAKGEKSCHISGLVFHKELTEDELAKIEDKKLLIDIAKYFLDNPISVNGIQQNFGLGFNRASRFIDALEKLKIISERIDGKRILLIYDFDEIKYLINTYAFK